MKLKGEKQRQRLFMRQKESQYQLVGTTQPNIKMTAPELSLV